MGAAPIKGILFDSGDTLVRPKGGSWWPKQQFYLTALAAHGINDANLDRFDQAIGKGRQYLNENHNLTTEEEEVEQFRTYHHIALGELGVVNPSPELLDDLMVPGKLGIEAFPDTEPVLQQLRRKKINLGVVSDNWPSLDRRYREIGIRGYFDAFVISAVVGCSKPCERIYRTAIEKIGLAPESLMFVDDNLVAVEGAIRLGMAGVIISRYGETPQGGLRWVADLEELVAMLDLDRPN